MLSYVSSTMLSKASRMSWICSEGIRCKLLKVQTRKYAYPPPFMFHHPVDMNNQSVLLPGPERIRASKLLDDPYTILGDIPTAAIEINTVFDFLEHGLKVSDDGDCVGTKSKDTGQYQWIKYSEVKRRAKYIGSAFVELGIRPHSTSYVGIFSVNKPEYLLTVLGCVGQSIVIVPLYQSLSDEAVKFIFTQACFPLVIADDSANTISALHLASDVPSLKVIVSIEPPTKEAIALAKDRNVRIMTFSDLEELGKNNVKEYTLPKSDDLFCIPYTSGTTGIPKGVMMTHRNITACLASLVRAYGESGAYGGAIISYLPPGHVYEIFNQVGSLYFARRIGYFGGDLRKVFDDIRFLKPTIIPLVPRLMNIIYDKAQEQIKSKKWKEYVVKFAMKRKEKLIKKGKVGRNTIWDKLVFRQFQEALGGNQHAIVCTSAPTMPEVMRFYRCAAGCYVYDAYGQTESLAVTLTLPYETGGGSVGPVLPSSHVKVVDVPDMQYFAENDEGEICYKGITMTQGYFKNPEATKEALDSDGWFHSGDIGKWLPDGTLKIIDRKKHLFKLSQGEYIAPERVERVYALHPLVQQVYCDGFPDKDYIVLVVVPESTGFTAWLKKKKFNIDQKKALTDKDVRKTFLTELQESSRKNGLNSLELAKNVHLTSELFSTDNGLLTPTFKLMRNVARKYFNTVLHKMYEEGPLVK